MSATVVETIKETARKKRDYTPFSHTQYFGTNTLADLTCLLLARKVDTWACLVGMWYQEDIVG
jgi:hypothetical protein